MQTCHSKPFAASVLIPLLAFTVCLSACEPSEPDAPEGPAPIARDLGPETDEGLIGPRIDAAPDPADMGPERRLDRGVEVDMAPPAACADGLDNDGDGAIDHPADPGCAGPDDDDEVDPIVLPECADGVDNDGDGEVDLTDGDCLSAADPTERGGAQGALDAS